LCEISNPAWGVHPAPLVYVYQFTIRPGKVKGWHVHRLHDDRIFISRGEVRVVLYDSRVDSPTHGLVNEIFRTALDRDLMVIPAGVYHAHQNCGTEDALFISMPTRAYYHRDPDVYRLPVNNDVIPCHFRILSAADHTRMEGDAPLVSVIVATYNWSSVLRYALLSAQARHSKISSS
jgi:dTDP-4-dehydrorhamnose 3,5-epimerase